MKLALAMIVKGNAAEAILLDRCLENMAPHVDGIFITVTQPSWEVEAVVKKYNGVLSHFEWCNDFAKARNYNFAQVPKEYDYIIWSDADDVWRGLEKLKDVMAKNDNDGYAFWYLYDFDENNSPTVVHKKTMIVRNDGCATWHGKLHEDLQENRSMSIMFVQDIDRMHFTTDERVMVAKQRNVEVALGDMQENPNDPRSYWNLGNSYLGAMEYTKARDIFEKFIDTTGSDEEKYLAMMRLGMIEDGLGNDTKAQEWMWKCIGLRPNYPDAYNNLAQIHFGKNRMDEAERYLLDGLVKPPPYHSMIVYNPRDYDYNPMMALAKVYVRKGRPDLALPMLKGCLQIEPNNEYLARLVPDLEKETALLQSAVVWVSEHENDDDETLKRAFECLDPMIQSHPAVCILRNKRFVKTESSGKDITYYCGMTTFEWNPVLFKEKGFGGSEEAVINLSREWAKLGYNVTVYNNCGTEPMTVDGVRYEPFWAFNAKNKTDYLIVWRHPKLLDYELNADHVYVDVHDVVKEGEFNEKRLKKIEKIFLKTQFHRSLFPNIPDEKIQIVPNGIDTSMFQKEKKDQYLMVNTSSPDRSMGVLPELFKRVKEQVPEARCQWAYGWNNFDDYYKSDKEKMAWKEETQAKMKDAGVEDLGRLPQHECAKLYGKANIFAYPSEFAEIDCISVKKAQLGGAIPVGTDFGAMKESAPFGLNVHSEKNNDTWSKPYQFHFEIEDEKMKDRWVDNAVRVLKTPIDDRKEMKEWANGFAWANIAPQWFSPIAK